MQVLQIRMEYALQESLKEELEWSQKHQIILPLAVNVTLEWYDTVVVVPKANGKVWLCLDPVRLSKVLSDLCAEV